MDWDLGKAMKNTDNSWVTPFIKSYFLKSHLSPFTENTHTNSFDFYSFMGLISGNLRYLLSTKFAVLHFFQSIFANGK